MFKRYGFILILISIFVLVGCGKVARETGSDGGSSGGSNGGGSPPPSSPTTYYNINSIVSPNSSYGSITISPNTSTFADGTTVDISAVSAAGYMFSHWEGDITGSTNISSVVMNSNKSLVAVFEATPPDLYTIYTSTTGSGSISKSPNQSVFSAGDNVQLQANPSAGWVFDEWLIDGVSLGGSNPVNINMNSTKNVTAIFKQQFTLSTIVSPSIAGVISPANGSVHKDGTTISLVANANSGYEFDHWEGDTTGTSSSKSMLMNSNKTVTAVFNQVITYPLTISFSPAGAGTVAKSPSQTNYRENASVQLQASNNTGYEFAYWSGDLSGSSNPANITMSSTKNITAVYKSWQSVGNTAWSDGQISYMSSFFAGPGGAVPYVVYSDSALSAGFMAKFNGTSWVNGGGYFSAGGASHIDSVYDSNNDIVYVSYRDAANGDRLTVREYKAGTWSTVGTVGFSSGAVKNTSIAIDSTSAVYVAYSDGSLSNDVVVRKFNTTSSTWDYIGSNTGITQSDPTYYSSLDLAIDGTTPYIAYTSRSTGKVSVMKWTGSWTYVGSSSGFSDSSTIYGLAMVIADGKPYVAYNFVGYAGGVGNCLQFAAFDGSSWNITKFVDSMIISNAYRDNCSGFTKIAMCKAADNSIYVAVDNTLNDGGIKAYKYQSGSFSKVGSAFSPQAYGGSDERYLTMAVYNNVPYVIYRDTLNGNKASCKKFDTP